ncbi:MAG: hypothetical protein Kow0069_17200 [Promethearchaeota archaeon]
MDDAERARKKRERIERLRKTVDVGQVFLSRFERSRVIGARALQIAYGAPLLIPLPEDTIDPVRIAERELEARVLPITIHRKKPDGTGKDVPLNLLIFH